MRSVVVVLPASMCAMMPMLRVFSRGNVRGMSVRECADLGGWGTGARGATFGGDLAIPSRYSRTKKAHTGLWRDCRLSPKRLYRAALHGVDLCARTPRSACARATAAYSRRLKAPRRPD